MMRREFLRISGFIVSVFFGIASAQADVRLPRLFSDNMVLQREAPIAVWGWADDGEEVTVRLNGAVEKTQARNGKWKVYLPKQKAGGPYDLTVQGKNEVHLQNILVGEVWICSGQSNMEFPMRPAPGGSFGGAIGSEAAVEASSNPKIRLLTVPRLKANEPVEDINASWVECNPSTVPSFSAVAYYFGRDLQKALKVPVGLIHTSWGGSPAEVWVREEIMEQNPLYKIEILDRYAAQLKRQQHDLAKWEQEKADLEKEGKKMTRRRPGIGWKPAELYNGMIAPLIPFTIAGAIWYQGESNAGRAYEYRTLFADMISNWRVDFGQGDFPFLLVQLAPWDKNKKRELSEITKAPMESDWAELREAQTFATKLLPKVGMAVITDVGDKDDIHPKDKEPVGARLALAARGIAYGQRIVYSGPLYKSMRIERNRAIVHFDFVGRGLEAKGGPLTGFEIAGRDRKFVWANAEIKDDEVVVSSPEVPEPVAVRYGWADFPVVNLFNKNGLPASPFRTDAFPMMTGPKLIVKK